ncbi:histidine acid phosphatase family protein [Stylonychia lemnae]|uniref:Histidine acid phosphatase family protein n=1 Tax=Stylonychia lemnae TaxID=5949 RepID=A0A077ZVJ7_STYLE|nr:histidine acid phosphatase family protein [Stylonychia lemnae]|eukprot:CDW73945.1 histidine acid phosphatase family protein [Stylonychia lemnae]
MVNHGSKVPDQFIIDQSVSQVNYNQQASQLTPVGMRQLYLRGREMRRRYIEDPSQFLDKLPNSEQIYAFSMNKDYCYVSAMSYLSGLYPSGLQQKLWDNQTQIAVPPIEVFDRDQLINELDGYPLLQDIQTIPIHSNAGNDFSMLFNPQDSKQCPIINSIQQYNLANNTQVKQIMQKYQNGIIKFLKNKVNIKKDFSIADAKAFADEYFTNWFEMRYTNYTPIEEEINEIKAFMKDYFYSYKYSNKTVQQVANQELFKNLIFLFDGRAEEVVGKNDNSTVHLKKQKYWYHQVDQDYLASFIAALDLQDKQVPLFSSSLVIQFYIRNYNPQPVVSDYDRSDYYVKFYFDDQPVKSSSFECNENFECSWDLVAKYFEGMKLNDTITGQKISDLKQFCFSSLNMQAIDDDGDSSPSNVPWWLAIVIAVPLVIITIAIIKIIMIVNEKKRRKREEQEAIYNRLTPQTDSGSSNIQQQRRDNIPHSINAEDDVEHNSTI